MARKLNQKSDVYSAKYGGQHYTSLSTVPVPPGTPQDTSIIARNSELYIWLTTGPLSNTRFLDIR